MTTEVYGVLVGAEDEVPNGNHTPIQWGEVRKKLSDLHGGELDSLQEFLCHWIFSNQESVQTLMHRVYKGLPMQVQIITFAKFKKDGVNVNEDLWQMPLLGIANSNPGAIRYFFKMVEGIVDNYREVVASKG